MVSGMLRGVAMALFVAVSVPAAAQDQVARKRIEIPRVESAPKLDDYAGGRGPGVEVGGFLQRESGDLVPVSDPTTAYLSYDQDSLYVARRIGSSASPTPSRSGSRISSRGTRN
jgi:hypothetical protein